MPKSYLPTPIDTSHIQLSDDLLELSSLLAKNTHENYVQLRMQDGWTYGTERNDARKQNPTLIPYEELSEKEQEYDRRTSVETIKVLLALGYRIEKAR